MKKYLTFFLLLFVTINIANGQKEIIITQPGFPVDLYGRSVAIDSYHFIIGAPGKNMGAFPVYTQDVGAAYLYSTDNVYQYLEAALPGWTSLGYFGSSTGIANGYAIVSHFGTNEFYIYKESLNIWAEVFHNDFMGNTVLDVDIQMVPAQIPYWLALAGIGGNVLLYSGWDNIWTLENTFTPSDGGMAITGFGASLAISYSSELEQSFFIIGAPHNEGAAYIFIKNNSNEIKKFVSDVDYDEFGNSVAIDMPYVIIGASLDNENGQAAGAAYIYKMVGNTSTWIPFPKLASDDIASFDTFGSSVAIKGNYVMVGAPGKNNSQGAVYLFKLDDNTNEWTQYEKITASDGQDKDRFGVDVAFDKNSEYAVIGAPGVDDENTNLNYAGKAYLFSGLTSGLLETSHETLNFGQALIGETKTLPITLTNIGLELLEVESVSLLGPDPDFFNANTTPFSLESGESILFDVSFDPDDLRSFEANLVFGGFQYTETVHLNGIGAHAFVATPESIDFGEQRVGVLYPPDTITLFNLGSSVITVEEVEKIGNDWIQFQLPGTSFPMDLPANSENFLEVEFHPNLAGDFSGGFVFHNSVVNDTVLFAGSGINTGSVMLAQDTVDFGLVSPTMIQEDSVMVANIGFHPVDITNMYISGPQANIFSVQPLAYPFTLPQQGSYIQLKVYCEPEAVEDFHAILNVESNGGGHSECVLKCSGTDNGVLLVAPSSIDFGQSTIGVNPSHEVLIGNFGISDLNVGPITLTGSDPDRFSVNTNNFTLEPTYIERLEVTFMPSSADDFSATLTIGSDGGTETVELYGSGFSCAPFGETKVMLNSISYMQHALSQGYGIIGSEFYHCNGEDWIKIDQLPEFSYGVAIEGLYAILGYPYTEAYPSGSVKIYSRSGSTWSEVTTLVPDDNIAQIQFGYSADFDGDYAIIGAPDDSFEDLYHSGSAYIYKKYANVWSKVDKIYPSDPVPYYQFGTITAISGDFVAVGEPKDDTQGFAAGAVYVFQRSGTQWIQTQKLFASDASMVRYFGTCISISGDYMVIGENSSATVGNAFVFWYDGNQWVEQQKLIPSHISEGYGNAVTISGDYVVVGAPNADAYQTVDNGEAFLFQRNGTTWTEIRRIIPSDSHELQLFGEYVDVDGEFLSILIGTGQDHSYFYGDSLFLDIDDHKFTIPDKYSLKPNYPNPFSFETTIPYMIPEHCKVNILIYDVYGKIVKSLMDYERSPGNYEIVWDGRNEQGTYVEDGIYYCRLEVEKYSGSIKLILMK